jgi:hypothetical protein
MHWWFIMRNMTNDCIYRYVNVLYCKYVGDYAIYYSKFTYLYMHLLVIFLIISFPGCCLYILPVWTHYLLKRVFPTYHTTNAMKLVSYPLSTVEVAALFNQFFLFPANVQCWGDIWQYIKLITCSSVVYVVFETVFCTVHLTLVSCHFKSADEMYFKHNEPPPVSVLWFTFQWFITQQSIPYFSYIMWDI